MITQFKNEYSWLSNFAECIIELDGNLYPSVEHAYMSAKSNDIEWKKCCMNPNNSAGFIKKYSKHLDLIPNWEEIKLIIMECCVRQKFNNEPFKSLLLSTGDLYIQDEYGDLIMKIRKEL